MSPFGHLFKLRRRTQSWIKIHISKSLALYSICLCKVVLTFFQRSPFFLLLKRLWQLIVTKQQKRVLRYLRGTCNYRLRYKSGGMIVNSFIDSNYAEDVHGRKSMFGYFIQIDSATVSWASKIQSSVVLSTCEADYYAITYAGEEIIWMLPALWEIRTTRTSRLY